MNELMWAGKQIIHPDHANGLNIRAATLEFGHKIPRAQAEAQAHEEYVRDQHLHAAAHHLAGMKVATSAAAHDDARKHGAMYAKHLNAVGMNPVGPVPSEVQQRLPQQKPGYKFKSHNGDLFALDQGAST